MLIDRIKEVVNMKSPSVKKFSEAINFNYTTLNNYFTGTRKTIDATLLEKIASTFEDVNYLWLLTGRGSMFRDEQAIAQATISPVTTDIGEASVYYRMYKEKDEEVKAQAEEIGQLKERLRLQEEQLGLQQSATPAPKTSAGSTRTRKGGVAGSEGVQYVERL